MFNQETGSSTNYLIIACMLISFSEKVSFFPIECSNEFKGEKTMELFFDLLFTTVCVFIPKCGLFAGLNFEAILVVLIDVLLLVYLICKASSDGSL